MLDRLQKTIQKHANWRTVLVLLVALIALSMMLNVSNVSIGLNSLTALSGGRMILDMRTDYTPDDAYELLEALGPQGRRLYATMHIAADTIFPVVYSSFFSFVAAWLLRAIARPDHPAQRLILLPYVAGLCDVSENVCILVMSAAFPRRIDVLARVARVLSTIKFGLMPVGVAIIAVCGVILLWRRLSATRMFNTGA
jgi:hypothetical protein